MENLFFGKSVSNTVKDIDMGSRTVIAHASIFGNIDSDDDIIQRGAYLKTIQENGPNGKNRVWHLFNHETEYPLSKPKVLREDEKGLYFESTMPDTEMANDILKLYEAGYLTEHSVWIRIIKAQEQVIESRQVRVISEVALMEVSSVLWGANEMAQTIGLKSIDDLNRRIHAGNYLMRNGTITDESFKRLESELAAIKTILQALEPQAASQQTKPGVTTLEQIESFKSKLKFLNQNGRPGKIGLTDK